MSDALAGRSALITGASQGLGLEIARAYLDAGVAGLCVCGRDPLVLAVRSRAARARVARASTWSAGPRTYPCGGRGGSGGARAGALGELTILVSNAGVYGPKGGVGQAEWAQWTRAVEINLYGSVLPARELLSYS